MCNGSALAMDRRPCGREPEDDVRGGRLERCGLGESGVLGGFERGEGRDSGLPAFAFPPLLNELEGDFAEGADKASGSRTTGTPGTPTPVLGGGKGGLPGETVGRRSLAHFHVRSGDVGVGSE